MAVSNNQNFVFLYSFLGYIGKLGGSRVYLVTTFSGDLTISNNWDSSHIVRVIYYLLVHLLNL